jgi:hypothetical protein|tara:strand:+ start:419 stop:706 length:288 start_codon:yes stop_codon:yes gene_type:complete
MDLNVDVICHDTGEVLKEGVLLASAHIYIAKRGGKIVKDEIEVLEVDEIDGGALIPTMEVRNLWVEIPEIQEEIRKFDERQKRWAATKVRGFWRD